MSLHFCHKHLEDKNKTQVDIRTQMQLDRNSTGNLHNFSYNAANARQNIVKFIVKQEPPFRFLKLMILNN